MSGGIGKLIDPLGLFGSKKAAAPATAPAPATPPAGQAMALREQDQQRASAAGDVLDEGDSEMLGSGPKKKSASRTILG